MIASFSDKVSMLRDLLLVGAGSFIGGAARYAVSLLVRAGAGGFPWGTFAVNILGCLLIGLLWGFTSRCTNMSSGLMLFLTAGFCGGFTTFSTFSKESLALLQSGSYSTFVLYAVGSVVFGIACVALGYVIAK